MEIINLSDYDLIKAITRSDAKAVHKDLPPGGAWRTVNGHHIYIKDGKVLAGAIPGVKVKAKKATKAQLAEHQGNIDKEAKKSGSKGTKKATTKTKAKQPETKLSGASGTAKEKKATAPSKSAKPKAKAVAPKLIIEPKKEPAHVELFHGTKLAHLPSILEHGFDPNGSEDDFGDAVYFKSPAFDHKDHADHQAWLKGREEQGMPIPNVYKERKGNDSKRIVGSFTSSRDPLVIKAVIDKKHVLDCSEGRPPELDTLIKEFEANSKGNARVRLVFKHLLGEDMSKLSDDEVANAYIDRKPDFQKAWGKSKFIAGKISPYELYAKKHGIGAIVDKLSAYEDEGYQIGVYDPKLINIVDKGKKLDYNKQGVAELVKALRKAMASGYTLLHHNMTDKGLELHIGAYDDTVKKAFLYIDLAKEGKHGGDY